MTQTAPMLHERRIRVWRWRLDPDPTGAGDQIDDLGGFSGNLRHPDDGFKTKRLACDVGRKLAVG